MAKRDGHRLFNDKLQVGEHNIRAPRLDHPQNASHDVEPVASTCGHHKVDHLEVGSYVKVEPRTLSTCSASLHLLHHATHKGTARINPLDQKARGRCDYSYVVHHVGYARGCFELLDHDVLRMRVKLDIA